MLPLHLLFFLCCGFALAQQANVNCTDVCPFITSILSCNDAQCACSVLLNVGSAAAAPCPQCQSNLNATVAEELLQLDSSCSSAASVSASNSALSTIIGSSTATASVNCDNICSNFDNFITCATSSTSDWGCICPSVFSYGTQCSQCRVSSSDLSGASLIYTFLADCTFASAQGYSSPQPSSTNLQPSGQSASVRSSQVSIVQTAASTTTAKSEAKGLTWNGIGMWTLGWAVMGILVVL